MILQILLLHYKLKGYTYSPFVNRQGLFLIGDSVVYTAVYESLEEYFGLGISLYGSNGATTESDMNCAEIKYQIPGGDYDKSKSNS